MILYHSFPDSVYVGKHRYVLNTGYARILEALDILNRKDWADWQKYEYLYWLLIKHGKRRKTLLERSEVVDVALRAFLPKDNANVSEDNQKSFDFNYDGSLIYAAFWQVYGIDLQQEREKLHFNAFLALLSALPSYTKLSDIIRIRTRPLPEPTKYNVKERYEILRLKEKYKLPIDAESQQKQYQKNLHRIAQVMAEMSASNK